MAKWTQPVREQRELVIEYLQKRFPNDHNVATDAQKRIVLVEIPSLSDEEMSFVMQELQAKFPGAF